MRRFGPDPRTFFDSVYESPAPWDIGAPQPALTELLTQFPPADPILDIGCGPGDQAIALAKAGHHVIGIDFAPGAIDVARTRRASLPADVRDRLDFRVADALHAAAADDPVGAIIDSGFLHLFDRDEAEAAVDVLAGRLRTGGRYYLLAFAVTFDIPNAPRAMSEEDVRSLFGEEKGWQVLACRPAELLSRIAPVPATAACIERAWGDRPAFDSATGRPT